MAGFAIVMTILIDGFFAIVIATIISITLVLLARKRLPQEVQGRRAFLTICGFAPFAGLIWLVAVLIIHVEVSNKLAHQDCGFSPDPYVTLPNGYILGSHNTYDGYIVAPGYQTDVPVSGPGYVRSIIDLRLSNGFFIGTQFDFKTSSVSSFVFDTRTRVFQVSDTEGATSHAFQSADKNDVDRWAAAETSAHDDATSYWVMYAQYRHHWPNYILIALILGGESTIACWLWAHWTSIRKRTVLR